MNDADLRRSLSNDVALVAAIVEVAPDPPVHHCPGWTVRDLVTHHGGVLLWAAAIVASSEAVIGRFSAPTGSALREGYVAAAQHFVEVTERAERHRAWWTFGRPPAQAWFWTRRQALEAAIHRWDAELAAGGRTTEFKSELCRDGISEVGDYLFPRQVELRRTAPLPCSIAFRATDTGDEWVLGGEERDVLATVEASAETLLLLLWRRRNIDDDHVAYRGSADLRVALEQARLAP